jgi:hypothetical protein
MHDLKENEAGLDTSWQKKENFLDTDETRLLNRSEHP